MCRRIFASCSPSWPAAISPPGRSASSSNRFHAGIGRLPGQLIRHILPRASLGHGAERARRPGFCTHGHAILHDRRLHHHVRRDRGLGVCMVLGLWSLTLSLRVVFSVTTGHDLVLEPAYAHQRIDAAGKRQRGDACQLNGLCRFYRGLDHPDGSHRHISTWLRCTLSHRASCRHLDRAGMHIDGQTSTITDSEQPVASRAQAL